MRDGSRDEERVKIRLLLTESELETLDRAVSESGALNRSLIIFEAVQAGLQAPAPKIKWKKRNRRVDAWTSGEIKRRIAQLANEIGVTQQTLLRYLLTTYISQLGRKSTPSTKCTEQTLAEETVG